MSTPAILTRRLGLHPWRMIAERYGGERPAKLKRAIASVGDGERYKWMRGAVGLEHGDRRGLEIKDCLGQTITINDRILDHIRDKPTRAPYLTWIGEALASPLEVWKSYRAGEAGLEARLYYLFATVEPELHSLVVIVGENDRVAFNLIPIAEREAKSFRTGELVYVGYDSPYGRCPHGCCDHLDHA